MVSYCDKVENIMLSSLMFKNKLQYKEKYDIILIEHMFFVKEDDSLNIL